MAIVQLTMQSGNEKTGPIPVSTTSEDTCPASCPMRGTDCYAKFGPLGMHWRKVSDGIRGGNWHLFCRAVSRFPKGQLWRHNQAGDLPHIGIEDGNDSETIDAPALAELVAANRGRNGFTYTHHDPRIPRNAEAIAAANRGGFTVNLSADNPEEADEFAALDIAPVVVTLPADREDRGNWTPGGLPIVICPATTEAGTRAGVNCANCGLCQNRNRKSVIGFRAHGPAFKRLSKRISTEEDQTFETH